MKRPMILVAVLALVTSLTALAHDQIYPHVHPHAPLTKTQDAGLSLTYVALLTLCASILTGAVGFVVGLVRGRNEKGTTR